MIYLVQQQEEESPCNEQSFDTRAVFISLSLANQQVLNIVREEHLEFFDGDDWSQFKKDDSGEVEEGMISWSISEIGELKLHCLPESREWYDAHEHRVFVERHVIRNELLTNRYDEFLERRTLRN